MLFFALGSFILFSLATFGSVQPYSWLLLGMFLLVGLTGYMAVRGLWSGRWHYPLLVLFCFAAVALAFPHSGFFLSVIAGLLAWVAVTESGQHTVGFLRVLVVVGVAEALLGFIQYFVSPGWIFGYINTAYKVSGTLINHNHFAGLLEMLVPVTLGLAYIGAMRFRDLARSYVYLLAGAVMGLGLLLSTSRMGIVSFLATVLFLGILLQVRQSRRRLAAGFTLTILGLVLLAGLWVGMDVALQRYSELVGQDAILREGRVLVYRDTVRMILTHPLGVGSGAFQDRFREYQTYRPNLLFDHAHNDYLESAAEWGLPLAILFWLFVGGVFVRSIRLFVSLRSVEQRGILLACIGAMFSILIHSLADFNLQIPSNAMLFFSFVGISMAMPFRREESRRGNASTKQQMV